MNHHWIVLSLALSLICRTCSIVRAEEEVSSPVAGVELSVTGVGWKRKQIYHSPQTPGFTSWVGAWSMPDDSVMVSFTQATGPIKGRPRTLSKELQSKLNWPPTTTQYDSELNTKKSGPNWGYDMSHLKMNNVYLRSSDKGKTWKQVSTDTFRSPMNGITGQPQIALPDGTIVRGVWGFYLPFNPELPKTGFLQRSTDGSRTWGKPQTLLDPKLYSAWPKRIRQLRDGRLIVLGGVARVPANSVSRHKLGGLMEPLLLVSSDNGNNWSKPITVIPTEHRENWGGEEFDAAELANGDLLCVFRRMNPDGSHSEVRWQGLLKKHGDRWVPERVGPAPFPHSGSPELLATREEVVLHVATSGVHWTGNAGKSWHRLTRDENEANIPGTLYYPRSIQSADGSILIFAHYGSDDAYGKVNQHISMDTFRMRVTR